METVQHEQPAQFGSPAWARNVRQRVEDLDRPEHSLVLSTHVSGHFSDKPSSVTPGIPKGWLTKADTKTKLVAQYGPREQVTECPRRTLRGFNYWTNEPLEVDCRSNSCLYCVRLKVQDLSRAIAISQPQVLLTLTGLSGTWQQDRDTLSHWRRYLTRASVDLKMTWAAEPNPSGTGGHVHGWAHSPDPIDPYLLQQKATKVGLGIIDVTPVTHHGYLSYPLKSSCWNSRSMASYRQANSTRLTHGAGFFRDTYGQPLTQGQALAAARWALAHRRHAA